MSWRTFLFSWLKKAWTILAGNYIEIEVWSSRLNDEEEKTYIRDVVCRIQNAFPRMQILRCKKALYLESRNCPYLHFEGYEVWLSQNVDPQKLKNLCMELEMNPEGQRISDIDIYCKGEKISRKTANEFQ